MGDILGDIGDAVLGSEGTPGQIVDVTPDEFAKLRDPIAKALGDIIKTGGGPKQQSQNVAPITSQEQDLVNRIFGQVSGTPQGTQTARNTLTQAAQGEFLMPDSNPFLKATIEAAQRPVTEAFQENTLPRLREGFTLAGQKIQPQSSSPFDMAVAEATQGLTNELGDISTEISFGNYQAERDRQQEAAAALPALDQGELDQTIAGLQAVALPRMIEDMGIQRGTEEFRRRIAVLLQALGDAGALASPVPQTIQPTPGTPGALQEFARGFGRAIGGG